LGTNAHETLLANPVKSWPLGRHQDRWILGKWKVVGETDSGTWCWGWWTFGFVEPPEHCNP